MKTATWACVTLLIGFTIGFCVGVKYESVYPIHWDPRVSDDFNKKMRQVSQEMDANYEEYQTERRIRKESQ